MFLAYFSFDSVYSQQSYVPLDVYMSCWAIEGYSVTFCDNPALKKCFSFSGQTGEDYLDISSGELEKPPPRPVNHANVMPNNPINAYIKHSPQEHS